MMTILGAARDVRRAGVMAVAAMAVTAMSHGRAEAMSLASPAGLPSAKYASEGLIEVRGGHGGGHHGGGGFRGGGGGGFRGGAIHGGGMRAYHGGGFRAAHVYRGGGYRFSGYRVHRYAVHHRPYFHRRHFVHRRYYAPYYSSPRCTYGYRVCRVVWTYYGPRKICRCRPWRHHYWRYGW
jgi:hypothetical protein